MARAVVCPRCGRENGESDRFCGACGAALSAVCPSCGAPNPPDASFCSTCGSTLAAGPSSRPGSERRIVTVLFADLVGFTSRAERLDPEDVQSILSPYYARLRQELEHFGGTVEKFIGDAVVAFFGAPVAHGDDPERGVRAALAVRDAIAEMNAEDPSLDLQVRIAVNTGEAIVALDREAYEGEGLVAGDVVNTASRLQGAAPTNGILVGEETFRATQGSIRYRELPPVEVKGKSAPVPVWLALEALGAPAERQGTRVAMVGRDRELAVLTGTWERVVGDARPHLVTVFGPPGIGKTRLTTELCDVVAAGGARVVRGRSFPYGGSSPYGAFGSQLKQIAGIFDTDPIPDAFAKLELSVASLLGAEEAHDVAGQVATLVGLEPGRAAVDRSVAFFAARKLVEALGRDRPTLLVFEDIHWAEPGLLDLLESFASRLRDVPVLLLTLARPELLTLRPGWGGGLPAYTALPLEPLVAGESLELARLLLGEEAAAAARLSETAEGNPLFLEELAASVREGVAAPDELPTNVRGIIAARLDTLPAEERALILDAAVAGKVFWRGMLAPAHGAAVDDLLDRLEGRDLVRREPVSRIEGEEQFSFKHMLIREVAYATLPRAVRRERHTEIASFLEGASGERAGEWASLLAHHWREAGDHEQELRWVLVAAERGWANDALALYERALELIPAVSVERRRDVELASAIAHVQAGVFAPAIEALEALLPFLEERRRFDALSARGRAAFWLGDAAGAHRFWNEAREVAEALGDHELQVATSSLLATAAAMDGAVVEALELNERALAEWTPGARPREYAEANLWSSIQFYWVGNYVAAVEPARRGARLSEEAAFVEGMVSGPAHLGLALAGLGRHEEALVAFEQAVAAGANFEVEPRFTSRATAMWSGTLRELFELADARQLAERAIALGAEARFPGSQVSGKIDLLVLDLLEGEVGRAEAAWSPLWEASVQTKGWHQWLWTTRLLHAKGEIELASGRAQPAAEAAQEALELAQRYQRRKYVAASRALLGRALLELGRAPEAVATLRTALAAAQELRHPQSVWPVAGALARALERAGDDAGAEEALGVARASLDDFAAGLTDDRRARFLASPHLEPFLRQGG
ncbi:MAG TPA: adenylate/guanylate cyclase domain-containing protein [Gaiellaceae bacterium]|nr:adenylate/guanylate cyclase domain-containing protein [Gaiellaceae bacterium]